LDSSSIQVCFLVLCSLGFSLLFLNFFFSWFADKWNVERFWIFSLHHESRIP
jgi:hypothetical protein